MWRQGRETPYCVKEIETTTCGMHWGHFWVCPTPSPTLAQGTRISSQNQEAMAVVYHEGHLCKDANVGWQ